jgi:hypothetical protein
MNKRKRILDSILERSGRICSETLQNCGHHQVSDLSLLA